MFTCNHCPYALAWHERLQDVARDYADRGVRFLQINSNNADKYPRDSVEACGRGSRRASSPAPYLVDESQEVARAWGAKTTPDVFVTDASGVVYRGAPDADYGDPSLNASWLREALDDVLAGRPVAPPGDRGRWAARSSGSRAACGGRGARRTPSSPTSCGPWACEFVVREIVSEEDAARERFPGSPTIRVDGADLFPIDEPPSLTLPHLPPRRRPLLPHARPRRSRGVRDARCGETVPAPRARQPAAQASTVAP